MRNAPIYKDFGTQVITAVMQQGTPCNASWTMGVWMYDVRKADCVFYPLKKNARCGNNGPFKTKNKKHVVK